MMCSLNETGSTDNSPRLSDPYPPILARTQPHSRPPSAAGGKSKIPTNVRRNPVPGVESDRILKIPVADTRKDIGQRVASKSFNSAMPSKGLNAFSGMHRRQLENQLHVKKNKYVTLKKDLVEKQKYAIEMYEDVVHLRKKLIAAGGKDSGKIDAIPLLCDQSLESRGGGDMTFLVGSTVSKEFISTIQLQLDGATKHLIDVCQDTLIQYSRVLHRLMSPKDPSRDSETMSELKDFEVVRENLVKQLEAIKEDENDFRSSVMSKVSILWSEIEACRIRIKHLEKPVNDVANQLRTKLNSEAEKMRELQEKKSTVNDQLQKAKLRIKELEGKLEESQIKISHIQGIVKNLEAQLKQVGITKERRISELQKSLKNSEATIAKLESQRESLELRRSELKKDSSNSAQVEMQGQMTDLDGQVQILENHVKSLQVELAGYQDRTEKLAAEKLEIEIDFKAQLEKKSLEVLELQRYGETLRKKSDSLEQQVKSSTSGASAASPTEYKRDNNERSGQITNGGVEILKGNDEIEMSMADFTHRIKEMEMELTRREMQLQHKERLIKDQVEQLKVHEELITILKTEQDTRAINMSNKNLVGKVSLEELYSTLEEKQTQLVNLEKMVKEMEDQERHAQEQRTRQEKRIAQLELMLQTKTKENRFSGTLSGVIMVNNFCIPINFPALIFSGNGSASCKRFSKDKGLLHLFSILL
ncbi:ELKS/Rab6-interacting/CAST family member 1-like isoform X2 [Diachasmimorpha longicaudata]|uniref:ELKS/Rab6-interacting/CAST family member 1-like isoform X2 n=1 Tax=Diachasmimorpha longicaudata TaxID=58733 RepID=UPI0030B88F2E